MSDLFDNEAVGAITSFHGDHRWLSNFWPCRVEFEGVVYPSVENAYQAAKFSPPERSVFILCTSGQAKRLGRSMPARADWDAVKVDVMRAALAEKFAPGTDLAAKLLATGDVDLVEGNTWGDTFWGVCGGKGHNHLGRLLMERRAQLQQPLAAPEPAARKGPQPSTTPRLKPGLEKRKLIEPWLTRPRKENERTPIYVAHRWADRRQDASPVLPSRSRGSRHAKG